MSFSELPGSKCTMCPRHTQAKTVCLEPIVVGEGQPETLVIGDLPSDYEDRKGEYIPDRALKLFAGWYGEPFVYTTAVKCGGRPKLKADETKACRIYTDAIINDHRPKRIIMLGAGATKAMTRKRVTDVHGQTLDYQGYPAHALYSPGMALRDPSKIGALERAAKRILDPMEEVVVDQTVIRTHEQWNQFVDAFTETERFSFDTETTGLDWYRCTNAVDSERFKITGLDYPEYDPEHIRPSINSLQITTDDGCPSGGYATHTWVLPLAIRDTPWSRAEREEFIQWIALAALNKKAIAHNGKFDNLWLYHDYGVRFPLWFDTTLASHTLDENRSHSLKPLAVDILGVPGFDIPIKDKQGLGDLRKFYDYAGQDALYTFLLAEHFLGQLRADRVLRRLFFRLVMPAARMMEDAEIGGHFVDTTMLRKTKKRLKSELFFIEEELNELAGREVNWSSPQQVAKLLYEDLGIAPVEWTDEGSPSTGESALNQLELDSPIVQLLKKYRGVQKNLSTYVEGWEALTVGDRLFMPTKLNGTVTGRWSSRLHQVPRDPTIRGHIDAPEGWTLVVCDYSQIELRLVGHESQDPMLLLAYSTGQDVHSITSSRITGIDASHLTKEQRKMAKPVNFGFVYGMQWKKFRAYSRDNYEIDITDEESKRFRQIFFDLYNALPAWHERQRKRVRASGYVVSLSGRRRRLPGIHSSDRVVQGEAERQAINAPIQGFGSGDLKAMGMVEVWETFPAEYVKVRGEVHDSVLYWIKTHKLDQYIPRIRAIMEAPKRLKEFGIELTVPLVVDVEVGRWGYGEKYEKDRTESV